MRSFAPILLFILIASGFARTVQADGKVKAADLVGAWVRVGPADVSGFEFNKDGKVLVYFGSGGQAETDEYSMMDDGRLNLSMAGGALNTFFLPTLSGDRLQLKFTDSGKIAAYRRLKDGEAMAAAIADAEKADKQTLQNRNAALPSFLAHQDLVMVVVNPPPNAPANCALQISPTSNIDYSGRAYFDSKPPHIEQVGAEIQGRDSDNSATVAIWFGPGTAQQNGGRGLWMFHVTGSGNDMYLTAQLNFGEVFSGGPNTTVNIKSDAAMYKQITDGIKAEAARLQALKAPLVAMLKDYLVLKGVSQAMNANDHGGMAEEFTLSRNGNTWVGQAQSTNRTTGATEIFPVMAGVGIVKEKPVIQIASQKRVYQFTDIDIAGGKLTGIWALPQNPTGHAAEFSIVQAADSKARDQLFATRKAALQKLSGITFHGTVNDQFTDNQHAANPITVTLAIDEKGGVTGKAQYAMEGCTMTLAGKEVDTPLGPQIVVQYKGGEADPDAWTDVKGFIDLVKNEMWTLSAAEDSSGATRLNGYAITRPAPNAPPLTLQLIPFGDKEKADLTKALADGVCFKVANPQMGGAPDTILTFSTGTDGKINAQVTAGGSHVNMRLNQKLSGDVKDKGGWTELDMFMDNFGRKPNYGCIMLVTPTDAGLYINCSTYSTLVGGPTKPGGRWDAVQAK